MIDIWEFLALVVATLIGTGVGFGLALWWDRTKKKDQTTEDKITILEAIKEELRDVNTGILDPLFLSNKMTWKPKPIGFDGKYYLITIPAFESAINSGHFSILPPTLQTDIGKCYNAIKSCMSSIDNMLNFYSTPIYTTASADVEARKIELDVDVKINEMSEDITDVMPKIEKMIKQLQTRHTFRAKGYVDY